MWSKRRVTCSPAPLDTTCLPKHWASWHSLLVRAGGQHEETPERGRGLWARNTGAGLDMIPLPIRPPSLHPGNWTRQASHWPSRRGPALPMRSPQTSFFGKVLFCPLSQEVPPSCFSNRWPVHIGRALQSVVFVSFPFWGVKLFNSKALSAELPRMMSYCLPSENRHLEFFL